MPVFLLSDNIEFPPPELAGKDGLLAVGGDLSEERLLLAYEMGIFPWFSHDEPVLWWSPDPRLVLYPDDIVISKSLKKIIKKKVFQVTFDAAFGRVINACAAVRLENNEGTWLVDDMIQSYGRLHASGYAHSVEAWFGGELVGGLYGVSLGRCFFGESMFTNVSNASKVAFVKLVDFLKKKSFGLIDCQVKTDHLIRFGAREIPRQIFLKQLENLLAFPTIKGNWGYEKKILNKAQF